MMRMQGFVTLDGLAGWLAGLAGQMALYAPRDVDGVLLYRPVTGSGDLIWEFGRPVLPLKEFFLPPTERLMIIEKTGQQVRLLETLPDKPQAIFGVRPCDASGARMLDALFLESEPVDPYYARRRSNTTLIGLACQTMGDTCFCTRMGGAPDDARDMDVMVSEAEGGYWVEAVTEKGKALLAGCEWEGAQRIPPGDPQDQPKVPASGDALAGVEAPSVDAWPAHFADPYWEQEAERCLSCRICAYVCPTCRCFDIRDEALSWEDRPVIELLKERERQMDPAVVELLYEHGQPGVSYFERFRCWDSCAGAGYRRIAGGHNPRPLKGQRLRNRFFCKFYYFPRQVSLGSAACTGCGRCIDACPVGVDVVEVLNHFEAEQWPMKMEPTR